MEESRDFRRKYETQVLPFYNGGRFGRFSGVGGLNIRFAAFEKENSSGALVILPGKSETYLKYAELLYDLRDLPLSLYAIDHRGMGFSDRLLPDPLKMHVQSFGHYLEDLETFVQKMVEAVPPRPLFVLGHSTGALIAATFMQRSPDAFQAGILISPFFDIESGPVPAFVVRLLARLLDGPGRREKYAPGQRNIKRLTFSQNKISHSHVRWSLWEEEIIPTVEAVRFGGVTNHWIRECLTAGRKAVRSAGRIKTPLLLLQAEQDSVVRLGAQNRFCRRAALCKKIIIEGARHEILIEREDIREQALYQIKVFLATRLKES